MTEEAKPQAPVNILPVDIADVDKEDLHWLTKLDKVGYDKRPAEELLVGLANGAFRLWRVGDHEGVLITSLTDRALWIEGLAGRGLMAKAEAIRDKLKAICKMAGREVIQGATHRPGLQRLYERMGHKAVAVIMEA